jgi:hypothetical protein
VGGNGKAAERKFCSAAFFVLNKPHPLIVLAKVVALVGRCLDKLDMTAARARRGWVLGRNGIFCVYFKNVYLLFLSLCPLMNLIKICDVN